ncbi:unnamed protein product [Triticum turgidum subsp. durum]|uniref:Photosystem II 10 kDa polypeptide, chloroplastic n=1 Tax=Triticum turgidum subsp. durum TaxID=4567 RepID=A0A9R0YX99_TRITD|nr:unnamed protein product [Triticum turgidum subsp. durum]
MSASVMASLVLLKPSPSPLLGRAKLRGVPPSARPSLLIVASKKAKKVQTAQPYGLVVEWCSRKASMRPEGRPRGRVFTSLPTSMEQTLMGTADIYTRRMVSKW